MIKQAVVMCDRRSLDEYLINVLDRSRPQENVAVAIREPVALADRLAVVEKQMLAQAARKCRTTREAAAFLGVSQPSVVRKFKKHGLIWPGP